MQSGGDGHAFLPSEPQSGEKMVTYKSPTLHRLVDTCSTSLPHCAVFLDNKATMHHSMRLRTGKRKVNEVVWEPRKVARRSPGHVSATLEQDSTQEAAPSEERATLTDLPIELLLEVCYLLLLFVPLFSN